MGVEEEVEHVTVEVTAADDVTMPHYATELAAGADVRAWLTHAITIPAGSSALVPTGIHMAIPDGYELQVRPRSGLALKNQVTVLNTPGTIDADYRGHVQVLLINHGQQPFTVEPGMRIAQLILAPVVRARFVRVDKLSETQRAGGGFGHSGLH